MSKYKIKSKIRESIHKESKNKIQTTKGIIKNYSNVNNAATVEIKNPYGGGVMILELVQVQLTTGVHTPGPFPGDEVIVEFINGNIMKPKIVAFIDGDYYGTSRERRLKHSKKGSYIPDYLNQSNVNSFNDSGEYEKEKPFRRTESPTYSKLNDIIYSNRGSKNNYNGINSEEKYPKVSEPALIHPDYNSIVKLRENGNIDIFTGSNTGIRVDIINKTINTFGTGINNRVDYIMDYINKDSTHNIKKNWTINAGFNATINAKGNVIINSENDIHMEANNKLILDAKDVIINGEPFNQN